MCCLRRLALETDEALKEQDKKLGEILGKLQVSELYIHELHKNKIPNFKLCFYKQVGVARRDEIIRRQNETIKAIEVRNVNDMTALIFVANLVPMLL